MYTGSAKDDENLVIKLTVSAVSALVRNRRGRVNGSTSEMRLLGLYARKSLDIR